jgi:aminopeptidase N
VIDFAWTASPNFLSASRPVGDTEILYLYLPEHGWTVERVLDAAEAAVIHFGDWFSAYPYPRLTVVDVPDAGEGAGGMEYPTLVTAGAMDLLGLGPAVVKAGWEKSLELVVIHEIGHQWWQSMVAFNEAEEPWLDEGFTDYATMRLANELYGRGKSAVDIGGLEAGYLDTRRTEYLAEPSVAMFGKAWEFGGLEYGIAAYSKPALSLGTLEGVLGAERMLLLMETFFERYRYGHPTTEDFRETAEAVSGQDLDWFFDGLVYGDGVVNYTVSQVEARRVEVLRQGDLAVPTEVLFRFADGSSRTEPWDGQEELKTFDFPEGPEVSGAEVDPERKVLVDLSWSDNGLARRADLTAWMAVVVRLLYQIQNALLALGGL